MIQYATRPVFHVTTGNLLKCVDSYRNDEFNGPNSALLQLKLQDTMLDLGQEIGVPILDYFRTPAEQELHQREY